MQRNRVFLAAMFALLFLCPASGQTPRDGTSSPQRGSVNYPERPIKVIVPFGAGGGSDTFARIIQRAIDEHQLLPQPIVILNVPGAGGSIGSRQVMEAEPDGYTLLCLHDGILSAKYAGNTDYGPEAFESIAGTGEVGMVIAVAGDAEYADLDQLLSDATARPNQVVFSANIGAPSHFAGLMLESAEPKAQFRYTQTGGGAKRFAALAGGHIDVSAFSLAEYMQFKPAGLRALAYCGETRHPSAPEIPTALEQGCDVISSTMQFWWAPKNTPTKRTQVVAKALESAMQTRQVQDALEAIRTDAVVLTGERLQQTIAEREQRFANVVQRDLTELPNFPNLVLAMVAVLSLVVGFQSRTSQQVGFPQNDTAVAEQVGYLKRPRLAIAAMVLTGIYVLSMQLNWLDFRVATFFFILGLGTLLSGMNFKHLPWMVAISIAMSIGLHLLFIHVFAIDLP